MSADERLEEKRSKVRIYVTYAATVYAFGGSALLIFALCTDVLDGDQLSAAKDIFFTVLPIATGVITYWFASRKPRSAEEENSNQGQNKRGQEPSQHPE